MSSHVSDSLSPLKAQLKDKINLFTGHSGVGKSSLINVLIPGLNLKVTPISEQHLTGKHSTTFAEMHQLPEGGFIIDTPGIREFGTYDFNKNDVTHYFLSFSIITTLQIQQLYPRQRKRLCSFSSSGAW